MLSVHVNNERVPENFPTIDKDSVVVVIRDRLEALVQIDVYGGEVRVSVDETDTVSPRATRSKSFPLSSIAESLIVITGMAEGWDSIEIRSQGLQPNLLIHSGVASTTLLDGTFGSVDFVGRNNSGLYTSQRSAVEHLTISAGTDFIAELPGVSKLTVNALGADATVAFDGGITEVVGTSGTFVSNFRRLATTEPTHGSGLDL